MPKKRKTAEIEANAPNFTELEVEKYLPVATRDQAGRFVKGQSGNPKGRPKNSKNELTTVKRELELAVRNNISPNQVGQIVHRMYELALMGSVGAAKLLLDKTISNARVEEDEKDNSSGVTIRIENLTLDKTEEHIIEVKSDDEDL